MGAHPPGREELPEIRGLHAQRNAVSTPAPCRGDRALARWSIHDHPALTAPQRPRLTTESRPRPSTHLGNGGPPIWIGGNTRAAIRRAARYGDGWLPYVTGLDALGTDVTSWRDLTGGRRCPTIGNVFSFRMAKPDEPPVVRSTTPWAPSTVAGSPDLIALHLEAYRQAGLEYPLYLFESGDLDDLLRGMWLFAEQVAPRFAADG